MLHFHRQKRLGFSHKGPPSLKWDCQKQSTKKLTSRIKWTVHGQNFPLLNCGVSYRLMGLDLLKMDIIKRAMKPDFIFAKMKINYHEYITCDVTCVTHVNL